MDEKTSLLEQLRIDRGSAGQVGSSRDTEARTGRGWLIGLISALVLAGLAVGGWFLMRPAGIPVKVAIAREVGGGSSPAAGVSTLDASGYVVARREATVSAKTTGKVIQVLVEEGDRVQANQVVARLDDSNTRAALIQTQAQLAQAEAGVNAAKVALDDAQPIFARNEKERAEQVISAQDFDTAKQTYNAAQTNYLVQQEAVAAARAAVEVAQRYEDDMTLRAPFAGVVTEKNAQPGEMVSPVSAGGGFTRTGICTIVDMDSLEAEIDVSENFINRVHAGQPAVVRLNAYPDWQIPATVLAIIPTADRSKATVKVRVGFKIKDPRILPEMGTRVSFLEAAPAAAGESGEPRAIVLPAEAVQVDGDSGTVFVIDGTSVQRRTVHIGGHTSDGQLMVSGVDAGTRVAAGDLTRLADHSRISIQE
jgi:RND family efflux transporter MFP subunit